MNGRLFTGHAHLLAAARPSRTSQAARDGSAGPARLSSPSEINEERAREDVEEGEGKQQVGGKRSEPPRGGTRERRGGGC